jgi:hypothetical protein
VFEFRQWFYNFPRVLTREANSQDGKKRVERAKPNLECIPGGSHSIREIKNQFVISRFEAEKEVANCE